MDYLFFFIFLMQPCLQPYSHFLTLGLFSCPCSIFLIGGENGGLAVGRHSAGGGCHVVVIVIVEVVGWPSSSCGGASGGSLLHRWLHIGVEMVEVAIICHNQFPPVIIESERELMWGPTD